MERTGRADTHDACFRRHPEPREGADEDRGPVGELGLRVDEQPGHTRRAGRREHPVLAEVQRAGVGSGEERLQLRQAQPRVGDDAIELFHQPGLGQRRQIAELGILGVRAERVAVVRRALDRVADQLTQALSLVSGQLLARPAVALQERPGACAERRGGKWVDRGGGNGRHVALLSLGTVSPRMKAAWSSTKTSNDTASGSSRRSAL